MDVSEDVLFNSLAQLNKNEVSVISNKRKVTKIQKTPKNIKVDILFELEKKIIEILLLYGHQKEKFEEIILKKDDKGNCHMEPTIVESLVYEKIFLDLQQDEVRIYKRIIQNSL